MNLKTTAALFFLALLPRGAGAEDAVLTAAADKATVAMDDAIAVRVTLSGGDLEDARPAAPAMEGFRASFAGQSQNISFVNGRVSSEIAFTYVLQPLSPGDHIVPPFTARVGGKTLSTEPIPIKVVPAAAGPVPAAPPSSTPSSAAPDKDLFLTATVDKKEAFVGEAVTLAIRFYSRVPLLSQPGYAPPSLTGFLSEDLPPQRQFTETVGGRRYTVIELKTALFPAGPGAAAIGPAALECRTNDFSEDPFADPFGPGFFQNFFSGGRTLVLRSEPLRVDVKPLPAAGRPADFRGDVGRYRLAAALDKSRAALHEPVTLTVTVSGEGDIKALSAPATPPLSGFKTYETLSSLNISKTGWKVQGSKVFRTVLKPEVSGRLEVPPVSFSYFDPETRAYRTARTEPLVLTVSGAESTAPDGGAVPAEGVRVISRDIRYLKPGPPRRRRRPLHEIPVFWLLNLLPATLFASRAGSLAWARRARPAEDAARRARRALKALPPEPAAALAALEGILRDYWAAKSGASAPAVTREDLLSAGADVEVAGPLKDLWDDLQRARYTPALATPEDARKSAEAFKNLLPALEALWKK